MGKLKVIKDTEKKTPYFQCKSCKINSLTKDRMCPCPRGGCEAVKTGTLITKTLITLIK